MENSLIPKPLSTAIATQLISTPHPVTLEGQRNIFAALQPGENLERFLRRNVEHFDTHEWMVSIGGVEVPRHLWKHVFPKEGQRIELVGNPGRTALYMIAIIVLTYYTAGLATGVAAGAGGAFGLGTLGTFIALVGIAAVQYAGTLLINKLLGPKAQSNKSASGIQQNQNYSLSSTSNGARPYQAVPILFGTYQIAPDFLSNPYSWFSDNDQYLALHLSWGIGVDHYEDVYLGTTKLDTYLADTQKWDSGFSGVADQTIPLFGNVDTQDGGPLQTGTGALQTVSRTTSINTTRIGWDFQYQMYNFDSKGRIAGNSDTIDCQYRAVGATQWITAASVYMAGYSTQVYRRTVYMDVPEGQYETQCFRHGNDSHDAHAVCQVQLSTLTSIQKDTSNYAGIARTAIQMRASAQLNGTPNQVNAVAHSTPIPVWKGTATGWVTEESSNPGAQMLKYLRGYYDASGKLIAGCGYSDDQIDIPALQAFMLYCAANSLTYNFWVREDRTHLAMLEALAQAGMGEYTDAMGLHSVIWVAQDQPVDAVVNMSRVQKESFRVDYTLLGTSDGIAATYIDKTKQPWAEVTMYVPSPVSGTTTITNPANVTLEGVTDEAHAAKLARLLMAQQVYQYKSVEYGTSFEWLTYRRYSIVQMQHDLTQWGYGGNIVSATLDGTNHVTLKLDVQVPPPTTGNAYIGLRIPGEASYRVFTVNAFAATTDTISLTEAWPADARVPGDDPGDNPAWDTLWIYDFKTTPGLSCRVINVSPQTGFKGATVTIVPESDKFWTYVNTGVYNPPASGSLLPGRPVASNLTLTEQQDTIGNVAYTTMHASFDVAGLCGNVLVYCDVNVAGQMELVATLLQERNASWRVDESRQYTVTVRPFTPDGFAGIPTTASYTPLLPTATPNNVDIFNITDLGDGLRSFGWGFSPAVQQPPNMAGVEIRYVAGNVPAPDWNGMQDMSAGTSPGYFTSAFTSNTPGGGVWTFAIRVVDTNGNLSTGMLIKIVNLSDNLESLLAESKQQADQMQSDVNNLLTINYPRFAGAASDFAGDNTVYVGKWSETTQRQVADNALYSTLSLIGSATGDGRAFILNSQVVQVTPGQSLAQTIASQQAQMGSNSAAISSESTTRANADSAISTRVDSVNAQVGTNTANITTVTSAQAGTDGRLKAKQTVLLDVNGYVTGYTSENTGSSSSFTIRADTFAIVAPAGGARTEFSSGNWRVYDSAGTLRVRMGIW